MNTKSKLSNQRSASSGNEQLNAPFCSCCCDCLFNSHLQLVYKYCDCLYVERINIITNTTLCTLYTLLAP